MAAFSRSNAWTLEDDEALKAGVERGHTAIRIAAKLRRTVAAVKARARVLGCPLERKSVPALNAEDAEKQA